MAQTKKETKRAESKKAEAKKAVVTQPAQPKKAVMAEQKKKPNSTLTIIAVIIIGIAIVAALLLVVPFSFSGVSFASFKSTFDAAARVSVVATYYNGTQSSLMGACYTSIVQVIAHSRKADTIDFYLINAENHTCTYSKTGLGGSVVPITTNASSCLTTAYSEPALFLNFSSSNATVIKPNQMFAYGNGAYMSACPLAVNLA